MLLLFMPPLSASAHWHRAIQYTLIFDLHPYMLMLIHKFNYCLVCCEKATVSIRSNQAFLWNKNVLV